MSFKIKSPTTRNAWLDTLYAEKILTANDETRNFSDKLYAARKLQFFLGSAFTEFHPKTMGLREFGLKHGLVHDNTLAYIAEIQSALAIEFPQGFIIKPCAAINTGGETAGNYFFAEEAYRDFTAAGPLGKALLTKEAYFSPLLKKVVSGEEYVIQDNISTWGGFTPGKAKTYSEVRVHTYEDICIPAGLYHRWEVTPVNKEEKFFIAESLVQRMLSLIPKDYLAGVAWGLDVMVLDNGFARIIDINTNRGKTGQWSGYLSRPAVIGAYTRAIEKQRNVRFTGLNGIILRNNLGNYWKYKKKYYLEGIR